MEQSIFTNTIRDLRKKAGYTQAEISQMLNIQRQTYCNYENASRTPPLEIIVALAELYHVSVDYLVKGSGPVSAAPQNPTEKKLLNDFSLLSENQQREVLDFIHFKKLFPG